MKKPLILSLIVLSLACTKTETPEPAVIKTTPPEVIVTNTGGVEVSTDYSKQKKLAEAEFKNQVHPASGTVKVYEDAAGVRTLVFENFKTDAGPDLRIYLATDLKASNFIEVSKKVENGNKMYTLPKEVDLKKQTHVVIWCKQFSVLFGSASF
jgi:Electron transfer DM13